MRTYGAVFVLFRPDADALANLERTRADAPTIVVVDNTPEPDADLHASLREQGLPLIDNRNRGGLAGAFNRGFAALIERGVELCFMLDQDSEVEPGFLGRMTAAADGLDADRFLIGPRIYEIAANAYLPREVSAERPAPGVAPVPFVISSGSAVTADAFAALGEFAEELFIEYVDVDYSLRAERAGIGVFVVVDEQLRQHTGAITQHGRFLTTNHVAVRRYYLVRNGVWIRRRYRQGRGWWVDSARQTVREIAVVLAFERRKLAKVVAIVCGGLDGLRDRMGPFETAHPRVHRFCSG